jgi:hypothetical protein
MMGLGIARLRLTLTNMRAPIQLRRMLAAEWTDSNPFLAAGEEGFELDLRGIKIGDGILRWNALPYEGGTGGTCCSNIDGGFAASIYGGVSPIDGGGA